MEDISLVYCCLAVDIARDLTIEAWLRSSATQNSIIMGKSTFVTITSTLHVDGDGLFWFTTSKGSLQCNSLKNESNVMAIKLEKNKVVLMIIIILDNLWSTMS